MLFKWSKYDITSKDAFQLDENKFYKTTSRVFERKKNYTQIEVGNMFHRVSLVFTCRLEVDCK